MVGARAEGDRIRTEGLNIGEIVERVAAEKRGFFAPNANGIYPAAGGLDTTSFTGYQNAWLRDNVMVAYSRLEAGDAEAAVGCVRGLMRFVESEAPRFAAVIAQPSLKETVESRPRVRFDANSLRELSGSWSHAQNDALGYVLWFRARLHNLGYWRLEASEQEVIRLFIRYFEAIRYWEDADSGAWEEGRKVNSSSVGAVLAGLEEAKRAGAVVADSLIAAGRGLLARQLPLESPKLRGADAAVLFLVYPLEVVSELAARDMVVHLMQARLEGEIGFRRYIGDSYYCQDYDRWFPPELRSADWSERIEVRDAYLQPGCEAQWSLFDSLLSVVFGRLYKDRVQQARYLHRAIGQLTPANDCPELYFLKRGRWTPGPNTPLLWAEANLSLALNEARRSPVPLRLPAES
ncbi:MAG: glycoside hydrolase family 15 protein [Bryobacteraceae bacterium]